MKRTAVALAVGGLFIAPAAQAQHSVASTFDAKLGGFVQLNTTWDSDENDDDNPSSFRKSAIKPGDPGEGRRTLRWTDTRTRLFLDVRGSELWGAKTRAYTEMDFDGLKLDETKGSVSAGNANTPRLRRAYMRWDWTNTWALIGQQTLLFYDAVSPFGTTYVEGVASGRGGMTGGSRNRAPAFFAGHRLHLGGSTLEVIGSLARHTTDNEPAAGLNDSGTRAARPAYETMVKYSMPLFGREALAAVSTYWGEEQLDNSAGSAAALRTQKLRSTGTGLQGALPLGPVTPIGAFELRGSWFRATNMSRWNLGSNATTAATNASGAITNIGLIQPIHAHGGWAELNWQITPKYGLALGGGRARDDRNDVRAIGGGSIKIQDNQGYWLMGTWQDGPWGFMASISNVDTMWVTPNSNAETRNDSQELHFVFRYSF